MLKTINLSKDFKQTRALNNVNINISKGDIYGFVGENGAGKSTLIKIVTNVLNPTEGSFKIGATKRLGSISSIIEEPALHMNLSALNNLIFQNKLLNLNKSHNELLETLNLVGLSSELNSNKKARNFSLGMKQRLSIAMSLLSDPEFILLDEPLNGLDPVGIKEIRELILKLNKEFNITFLISSHMLVELDKVATKYGFISKGVLLEEITTEELHKKARNYILIKLEETINESLLNLLNNYNFKQIDNKTIHILEDVKVNDIIKLLVSNNVEFLNVVEVHKTIEDYYLEIIGGKRNA